ncbi:MAG: lysine--tRNA ligase [Candidatus Falkowbacteria bacterium]
MEETNLQNPVNEREERLRKLKDLKDLGINPFPAIAKKDYSLGQVIENFKKLEADASVFFVCGRLRTIRSHGNLTFATLQDGKEMMQIALSKNELGPEKYKEFVKLIDMGDFIEVSGNCFVTHKGENSILAKSYKLLTKAVRPLPEKWHGLQDDEDKLRKRYLDIMLNRDVYEMIEKRAKFWQTTRSFLCERGFIEVETPTIEVTTGGAEANPFKTHHDDFDVDVYMRISVGELWQKRLMAAGLEKTYEIGRVYRNEGSSPDHLQEFTNAEFYWAYANYEDGMKLSQELYQEIAQKVFGKTKFTAKGYEFDLSGEWPRLDYQATVLEHTGIDVLRATEDEMRTKLDELKVKYEGNNRERLMDTLWKYCRKQVAGPAFLINHPKLVSPLAKAKEDNPELTERFQIIIAGSEVGNGFSELNDPIDQRERFEIQEKLIDRGDKEAMMPDWEFVEMLEHGMPPTCGFGFGERLFAFMMDKPVRETTLFPLMKPKFESNEKIEKDKQ